jgi:hypothetical protein
MQFWLIFFHYCDLNNAFFGLYIPLQRFYGQKEPKNHINEIKSPKNASAIITLVTQPMLQHRPNWSELRSMDSYFLYPNLMWSFQAGAGIH